MDVTKLPLQPQTASGVLSGGSAGLIVANKAANVIAWLSSLPDLMPPDVLDDTKFLIAGAVTIVLTVAGGYLGRMFVPAKVEVTSNAS